MLFIMTDNNNKGGTTSKWAKYGRTYRSFQDQSDLMLESRKAVDGGSKPVTHAGPGESMHNYKYAVDLGVIEWKDKNGNIFSKDERSADYFLEKMENDPNNYYQTIFEKVWKRRTKVGVEDVYMYESMELIHMQAFPANRSVSKEFLTVLNKAAEKVSGWKYKRDETGPRYYKNKIKENIYKCNFGEENQFYTIGSSYQMWNSESEGIEVFPNQVGISDDNLSERIQRATDAKRQELAVLYPNIKKDMLEAEKLTVKHTIT